MRALLIQEGVKRASDSDNTATSLRALLIQEGVKLNIALVVGWLV